MSKIRKVRMAYDGLANRAQLSRRDMLCTSLFFLVTDFICPYGSPISAKALSIFSRFSNLVRIESFYSQLDSPYLTLQLSPESADLLRA